MNDRPKKDPRLESMAPPRTEQLGKPRRSKRPSPLVPMPAAGAPEDEEGDLLATIAARLITAEQARKRAEEREREARAHADAVEAKVAESARAPEVVTDLARRLSEAGLRITAREAALERELEDTRALRAELSELTELAWRLAGPATAARIPALSATEPPGARAARMAARTNPSIRRPR